MLRVPEHTNRAIKKSQIKIYIDKELGRVYKDLRNFKIFCVIVLFDWIYHS